MDGDRQGADRLKSLISLRFPGVRWIDRDRLAAWLGEEGGIDVVLLDVRTEEEFAVSHLPGAMRLDPDLEEDDLRRLAPVASLARDATIVTYCSVGYRSAAAARQLARAGFGNVFNLEGGIFGWANSGRAVHRDGKPVAEVHPYDAVWGRLLDARLHPVS